MAKAKREISAASLLARVEIAMREGIAAMSPEELAEYERKSKKTVESIKAKAIACAEPAETHSEKKEALHA
jgi:hypothetical protein